MRALPLFLCLLLIACQAPSEFLTTTDNVKLAFTYHEAPEHKASVILLHMLSRTKEDYAGLSAALNAQGYSTIAVDLRGHGKSDGRLASFKQPDYDAMLKDVAAAKEYVKERNPDSDGKPSSSIVIVGASIGANLAVNYALQDSSVKAVVLLSPGLEYRGISIKGKNERLPVLIAASKKDSYSYESSVTVKDYYNTTFIEYDDAGHGTQMLSNTDLQEKLIAWLASR